MRTKYACVLLCALLTIASAAAIDCYTYCRNLNKEHALTLPEQDTTCKCNKKHQRHQVIRSRPYDPFQQPLLRIHELSTTARSQPLFLHDTSGIYYEPADYNDYLTRLVSENDVNQHIYIISPVAPPKNHLHSGNGRQDSRIYRIGSKDNKARRNNLGTNENVSKSVQQSQVKNYVDNATQNSRNSDFDDSSYRSSLYLDIGIDEAKARSHANIQDKTKISSYAQIEKNLLHCLDLHLALLRRKEDKSKLMFYADTKKPSIANEYKIIENQSDDEIKHEIETQCSESENIIKQNTEQVKAILQNMKGASGVTRPHYEYTHNRPGISNYYEDSTDSEVNDSYSRAIFDHVHEFDNHKAHNNSYRRNNQGLQKDNTDTLDITINDVDSLHNTTNSIIEEQFIATTTPVTLEINEPTEDIFTTDELSQETITSIEQYQTTPHWTTLISESTTPQSNKSETKEIMSTEFPPTTVELKPESMKMEHSSTTTTESVKLKYDYSTKTTKKPYTTNTILKDNSPHITKKHHTDNIPTTTEIMTTVALKRSVYDNPGKPDTTITLTTEPGNIKVLPDESDVQTSEIESLSKQTFENNIGASQVTSPTWEAKNVMNNDITTESIYRTVNFEFVTESPDIFRNRPKVIEKDIKIPKLETVELKNGSTITIVKDFEKLPNDDFVKFPECTSKSSTNNSKELISTEVIYNNTISNPLLNILTGKIIFLRDKEQIPLRFLQNGNGDIDIGIDGNYLCNNLIGNHNASIILSVLCNQTSTQTDKVGNKLLFS